MTGADASEQRAPSAATVLAVDDLPPTLPPRRSADPYAVSMAGLVLLVIAGFVMIALGKRSLARTLNLAVQLPGLVSGCVAGLAVIATGAAFAVVLHSRRVNAISRALNDELLEESALTLEAMLALERAESAS